MILVLTANTNTCRLYHYHKHPVKLTLLKEITHPENKLKNVDLGADRPGHYQGGDAASSRGAYSPAKDPKEIAIDQFSREIAKVLNHERIENDFEKLIVIAPPQMSGLLYQHLDKHVKDLVFKKIQKDILNLSQKELLEFLHTQAKYPD